MVISKKATVSMKKTLVSCILVYLLTLTNCSRFFLKNLDINLYGKSLGFVTELLLLKKLAYTKGSIESYLKLLNVIQTKEKSFEEKFYYDFLKPNFSELIPEISDITLLYEKNNDVLKMKIQDIVADKDSTLQARINFIEGTLIEDLNNTTISVRFDFKLYGKLFGFTDYILIQKALYEYRILIKGNAFSIKDIRIF